MRKFLFAALTLTLLINAANLRADGIDATYGANLPSVYDEGDKVPNFKGKEFKVLHTGVLGAGKEFILTRVVYENNAKCFAVGYARGQNSDLDVFVTESDSGNDIDSDTLTDNFPVAEWQSGTGSNVVNIRVRNVGSQPCSYVLLGNW